MTFAFRNESFSFEALRAAGSAPIGGANLGEVLATAHLDNTDNAPGLLALTLAEVTRRAAVSRAQPHWDVGAARDRPGGSTQAILTAQPPSPPLGTVAKPPPGGGPEAIGVAMVAVGGRRGKL